MPNADYKEVSEFLDSVPDEKLEDFVTKEVSLSLLAPSPVQRRTITQDCLMTQPSTRERYC